jgi:hypothetical protein
MYSTVDYYGVLLYVVLVVVLYEREAINQFMADDENIRNVFQRNMVGSKGNFHDVVHSPPAGADAGAGMQGYEKRKNSFV